jgi:hypothetical protein
MTTKTITLYRPVGPSELALIEASGWRRFPPRLPTQPIFYPVLTASYAAAIARDWNARSAGSGYRGYVTRFAVDAPFLAQYGVQTAGGAAHREYWIPAGELDLFNDHIVGLIEVVARFEPAV